MDAIENKIENGHLLTDIFGYWPSFHDAEVISFEMFRGPQNVPEPFFRVKLHVFEMTNEVDSRGFFVLKNHSFVTFSFRGVDESHVKWFNHQNALWELAIVDISSRQLEHLKFEIHFASAFGVEAEFKCRSVAVEAVDSIDPRDMSVFPGQSAPRSSA